MSTQTVVTRYRAARLQQRVMDRFAAAAADMGVAETEAKKAEKRYSENAKAFAGLKKSDHAKAGKFLDKLLDNGNAAERAARC